MGVIRYLLELSRGERLKILLYHKQIHIVLFILNVIINEYVRNTDNEVNNPVLFTMSYIILLMLFISNYFLRDMLSRILVANVPRQVMQEIKIYEIKSIVYKLVLLVINFIIEIIIIILLINEHYFSIVIAFKCVLCGLLLIYVFKIIVPALSYSSITNTNTNTNNIIDINIANDNSSDNIIYINDNINNSSDNIVYVNIDENGKNNNEICTICLETNCDTKLSCDHKFHKNCIKKWFNINLKCPICRVNFNNN